MNTNGAIAELRFREYLVRKGFEVALPAIDNGPVDILWREHPGDFWWSAQVKKVYYKADARGVSHPTVDVMRTGHAYYGAADADYLAAVDYEHGLLWLLRFPAVCGVKRLRLGAKWDTYTEEL